MTPRSILERWFYSENFEECVLLFIYLFELSYSLQCDYSYNTHMSYPFFSPPFHIPIVSLWAFNHGMKILPFLNFLK